MSKTTMTVVVSPWSWCISIIPMNIYESLSSRIIPNGSPLIIAVVGFVPWWCFTTVTHGFIVEPKTGSEWIVQVLLVTDNHWETTGSQWVSKTCHCNGFPIQWSCSAASESLGCLCRPLVTWWTAGGVTWTPSDSPGHSQNKSVTAVVMPVGFTSQPVVFSLQ